MGSRRRRIAIGGVVVLLLGALSIGYGLFRRELLGPEGDYFDSHGLRIHYTDTGQGVPVVLLHGLATPANAQWWRGGQVDALRTRFRVITMDLRGHGRSDAPLVAGEYGARMADDVVGLLGHLGIPKAHVVGYSLGGMITLKLTEMCPDRLLSATVCAAGWGTQRATPENLAFWEAVAGQFERGEAELLLRRLGAISTGHFTSMSAWRCAWRSR